MENIHSSYWCTFYHFYVSTFLQSCLSPFLFIISNFKCYLKNFQVFKNNFGVKYGLFCWKICIFTELKNILYQKTAWRDYHVYIFKTSAPSLITIFLHCSLFLHFIVQQIVIIKNVYFTPCFENTIFQQFAFFI